MDHLGMEVGFQRRQTASLQRFSPFAVTVVNNSRRPCSALVRRSGLSELL
jgi:hypothetical protein